MHPLPPDISTKGPSTKYQIPWTKVSFFFKPGYKNSPFFCTRFLRCFCPIFLRIDLLAVIARNLPKRHIMTSK